MAGIDAVDGSSAGTRVPSKQALSGPEVAAWHVCFHGECWRVSGRGLDAKKTTPMTPCMVGPCVARGFHRSGGLGLASMYPASHWRCCAPVDISAPAFSLADR